MENTKGPKPLTTSLAMIANGGAVHEAEDKLQELLSKMRDVADASGDKVKGKFQLTIEVEMHKGAMDVEFDVTIKTPKPKRESTLLFLDKNNNFSNEMTRQESLPLRDVSTTRTETRDVSTDTVAVKEV